MVYYVHPAVIGIMGVIFLIIGALSWRNPLWFSRVFGRWARFMAGQANSLAGQDEMQARWEAKHPEAETVNKLTIGCGLLFFGFVFTACGLLGLLTGHG